MQSACRMAYRVRPRGWGRHVEGVDLSQEGEKMKILITGGAGFIGSHLAERLLEQGDDVFIIDNLWTGKLANIAKIQTHERSHLSFRCGGWCAEYHGPPSGDIGY